MKVSLLHTVHVSLTCLLFFIVGEAPDKDEDGGSDEAEGEVVLHEDSEAGDDTIGVPVLASTPQRTVASLGVPEQAAIACPSGAPSAVAPSAIAPPTGAPPTGVDTAAGTGLATSSPQGATAASSSGIGSVSSYATSTSVRDKSCHCSCQRLVERVKALEETVGQLLQRQEGASTPKTPRGVPATLATSAQMHERVAKLGTSGKVFGEF